MATTEVAPFEVAHFLELQVRDGEVQMPVDELLPALEKSVPYARTVLRDGKPWFCAGLYIFRKGIAELWWHGSTDVVEHPVTVVKVSKRLLEEVTKANGVWRVQTEVQADWKQAQRFAEVCGLESEGVMRAFGPNKEDYIRYARIFA